MIDVLHRQIEFVFVPLGVAAVLSAAVGQNAAERDIVLIIERHDAVVQ